jgi:hypothetical protein
MDALTPTARMIRDGGTGSDDTDPAFEAPDSEPDVVEPELVVMEFVDAVGIGMGELSEMPRRDREDGFDAATTAGVCMIMCIAHINFPPQESV